MIKGITCDSCDETWNGFCPLCKKKDYPIVDGQYLSQNQSIKKKKKSRKKKQQLINDGVIPNNRPNRKTRERIKERDGNKCLNCKTTKNLTIDHIVPRAKGGGNEDENLQTLCEICNRKKGNRIRDYRYWDSKIETDQNAKG